jgi:hypothetical protein
MKISNDTIGNQTRDLPACSAVPRQSRDNLRKHQVMWVIWHRILTSRRIHVKRHAEKESFKRRHPQHPRYILPSPQYKKTDARCSRTVSRGIHVDVRQTGIWQINTLWSQPVVWLWTRRICCRELWLANTNRSRRRSHNNSKTDVTKQGFRIRTGIIWFRTGSSGGLLWSVDTAINLVS